MKSRMASKDNSITHVLFVYVFVLGSFSVISKPASSQILSSALLVVNRGDHSVAIVDPLSTKVVASVPMAGTGIPHEIAVSADGKLAFVTHEGYTKEDA